MDRNFPPHDRHWIHSGGFWMPRDWKSARSALNPPTRRLYLACRKHRRIGFLGVRFFRSALVGRAHIFDALKESRNVTPRGGRRLYILRRVLEVGRDHPRA